MAITEIDMEIDARGLWCPLPILRLAKALRGKREGTVARLLATDPAAVQDVEIFCREREYRLLDSQRQESTYVFLVQKTD